MNPVSARSKLDDGGTCAESKPTDEPLRAILFHFLLRATLYAHQRDTWPVTRSSEELIRTPPLGLYVLNRTGFGLGGYSGTQS